MSSSIWYYHKNLKPQGPVTLAQMKELIRSGEVQAQDLICYDLESEWKPAAEWSIFERSLFPATQQYIPGAELNFEEKSWVVLIPDGPRGALKQDGPYSLKDLQSQLQAQRITDQNFIWRRGLSGWCRIADRPEFQQAFLT